MSKIRRLFAAVMTLVMAFAVSTVAFADGTGTITITPPAGTGSDVTNTYNIYKVFDADGNGTNISYKLVSGKTAAPEGFTVDAAGNVTYTGTGTNGQLTTTDMENIAAYVANDEPVATATSTGTSVATATGLPNGYYYIETSTGTAVTIDSTNPNVEVNDKNTVPTLDKRHSAQQSDEATVLDANGKKALAQVGKKVDFEATVAFDKNSKSVAFHDKMGSGLELDPTSISITGLESNQYDILTGDEAEGTDTFTVKFKNITDDVEATISYKATVTDAALTIDTGKNTAKVTYGDENGSTPEYTTNTFNASIAVLKVDGNNTEATNDDTPLEGAGFKLKNAEGKYYHLKTNSDGSVLEPKVVEWVDEADGDEHVSDADGKVPAFDGLQDGKYTLTETTVPSGYNTAADKDVTINASSDISESIALTETIANNTGTVLPSTGGIGTTIFYIVGGALFVVGAIIFITKKRVAKMEDEA